MRRTRKNKRITSSTNVMLPIVDKKQAIELGINISDVCRHALRSRIRNHKKRLEKERAANGAQTAEPIARVITPDQVTLAGEPAQIPAEVILDNTIAELKEKDPEGSHPYEVNHTYEGANDKHAEKTEPEIAVSDRGVALQ